MCWSCIFQPTVLLKSPQIWILSNHFLTLPYLHEIYGKPPWLARHPRRHQNMHEHWGFRGFPLQVLWMS